LSKLADTGWLDELPLDPAARWPAMGVRADDRPWPERADAEVLAHRRSVLAEHPDVVQTLPGSEAACAEVADLARAADFAAAAVAQADDLCLLAPEPGWPFVAGAMLYPSHWRLSEKLGRPLADVHDRVPGYPADQVDRFLDRLRPGQVVWRRNLLVHREGELHAPWPSTDDVPIEHWWLRSERQTLRVLPETGAVLFTIRSDTIPLATLEPDFRRRLAARFESLPPGFRTYSGFGARLDELVEHLRSP
jgi:dimethylamine monooxygenase subunit A